MKWKPKIFKTNPLSHIVTVQSVTNFMGDIRFCVTLSSGVHNNEHYFFKKLSSAIDFIDTNFND